LGGSLLSASLPCDTRRFAAQGVTGTVYGGSARRKFVRALAGHDVHCAEADASPEGGRLLPAAGARPMLHEFRKLCRGDGQTRMWRAAPWQQMLAKREAMCARYEGKYSGLFP